MNNDNMKAYLFPGQGAQFEGMGKDLFDQSSTARDLFEQANDILGYRISEVMFGGSAEELKETRVTQPAIFLHSIITAQLAGEAFVPDAVAGHSLGEFSALVAAGALSFSDGLQLVQQRALAMQSACDLVPGTMAAILGQSDEAVEAACAEVEDVVIPANYNSPGQLVISGTVSGVQAVVDYFSSIGARAIVLPVGGAFHSPLMQPAQDQLRSAIEKTGFSPPKCPVYQNITALPETDPERIQVNLIEQLTGPVRWTQTMQRMLSDGVSEFIEVGGTGKVLQGLIKKIDRRFPTSKLEVL